MGDLTTGLAYRFSVQAINDNGNSTQSSLVTFYACQAPSGVSTPTYVSSFELAMTITVSWTLPKDSGGCAITGYRLFMDDGLGGDIDNPITDLVDNDPSIQSHLVDMTSTTPVGVVGRIYKFRVEAINNAGSTSSNALSVALASLPD